MTSTHYANHHSELTPGNFIRFSTELEKSSPFFFGYKIEDQFIEQLKSYEFDKLFFFVEENLYTLYGNLLFQKLEDSFLEVIVNFVPQGEQSKNFHTLEMVCEQLIEQGCSKKSILLSFGGGSVGNLVGMAAGLIFRGIRYVEIPTTSTGQSDSTLSNKQAVNGKHGKNHFGIYHAPLFVWADTNYLSTEPSVATRCGIIEGIKNGFISNPPFLDYLEYILNPEIQFSPKDLHWLTYNIILSKLEILRRDRTEKEYGIILEYGHTFGHGIEWLEHGKLTHGESVAFGMRIAAKLAHELELLSREEVQRHHYLIEEKLGFKNPLPKSVTTETLMNAMLRDNKKTGRELRFVLLKTIGGCFNPQGDYLATVDLNRVRKVLDDYITSYHHRLG